MPDRPPPSADGLDPELLGRYLAHECTEAEAAAVRRYLMAHPDEARALDRFVARLDGADGAPSPPDARASWDALRARLREAPPEATLRPIPVTRSPVATPPRAHAVQRPASPLGRVHPRHWWRHALTVLTASAATLAGVMYGAAHRGSRGAGDSAGSASTDRRAFVTAPRERAEIRLSDGTRIRMAPETKLRIASDFGIERRDVYLEGEAFFEVKHDARRPFTVFAGSASAHDLGTDFAVRSYPDDHVVQVAVRAGSVALSGVGPLGRGDVGRLANDGHATVAHGVDVDRMLRWLDGELAYRDAPLGEVLRDVRRWYDVDVHVADSALEALPFTGTLTEDRTDDAVGILAATLGLRARRHGSAVVLEAIPGTTPRPPSNRARRGTRSPRRQS